ncbi:hypothetical protein BH20VER2_BH20VER2_01860 [soil metagenome]
MAAAGKFTYVYILQSETDPQASIPVSLLISAPGSHVTTRELSHTLQSDARGASKPISPLSDAARAAELENYLKSASGRAFATKRL